MTIAELNAGYLDIAKKYCPEHKIKEILKKYSGINIAYFLSFLIDEYDKKLFENDCTLEEATETVNLAAEAYAEEMEITGRINA
jgi:hypothetical protein